MGKHWLSLIVNRILSCTLEPLLITWGSLLPETPCLYKVDVVDKKLAYVGDCSMHSLNEWAFFSLLGRINLLEMLIMST